MPDLHDTHAALAEQTVTDALRPLGKDGTGSFSWQVTAYIAGVLLALLSAPFVPF